MRRWKAIASILIMSLLLSISIPLASAPPNHPCEPWPECKGGSGEEPPADPAIAYFKGSWGNRKPNKIMVMNADGSNQAEVFKGNSTWNFYPRGGFSWSPDGDSITWAGEWWFPTGGPASFGVWRLDVTMVDGVPQGSNLQQLVSHEECYLCSSAVWSTNGNEIIYSGLDYQSNNWWIESISPEGGTSERFYETLEVNTNIRSLTWNSDGTRIAFVEREMSTGDKYIKIIERSDGSAVTDLVKGQYDLQAVDWARGVDTLAFSAEGPRMIYTIDIATGIPVSVVDGDTPCWSPDNTELVYLEFNRRGRPSGIYNIDLTSGETTELSTSGIMPEWRRF